MKIGKSLPVLEAEIARQHNAKRDFLAPARRLHVSSNGHTDLRWAGGEQAYSVNTNTHAQIAQYTGVPLSFYEFLRARTETLRVPVTMPPTALSTGENVDAGQLRLCEDNPLFDVTINRLLHDKASDEKRLIRTLDGKARALLSASYNPDLDNLDVYTSAAQAMLASGLSPDDVVSSEVTDTRLYLKVISPGLVGDVAVGDTVQAGFILTNSEVGVGSLSIRQFVVRLICLNGAVVEDTYRARHVGRKLDADNNGVVYKSDTRQAEANLRLLTMRDHIQTTLDEHRFAQTLTKMQGAAQTKLEGKIEAVVEVTARKFGLHEGEKEGVLKNLIEGGALSLWGLSNAITLAAQSAASYDRATDLETIGGRFFNLPAAEVREIVAAK